MEQKEMHTKLARDTYNRTWELLDKKDRTEEESVEMVHTAHASRYHWGQVGTPVNHERGDWQISRVYAVLGRPELALEYAQRCLGTCEANGIGDFDVAFAYEAMARAHAVAGRADEAERYIELAKDAAKAVKEQADREVVMGELRTIPGYTD